MHRLALKLIAAQAIYTNGLVRYCAQLDAKQSASATRFIETKLTLPIEVSSVSSC